MSLVSDALKKAQRDAALREAREKGLPEPLVTAAHPFRAKRAGARALPVTLALAAILLAAAGVYFLRFRNQDQDGGLPVKREASSGAAAEVARAAPGPPPLRAPAAPPSAASSLEPLAVAPDAVPTEGRADDPPPAAPQREPAPEAARTASAGAAPTPPTPATEVAGKPIAGGTPGTAPAAPPPAPQAQVQEGERVFVRVARLDDGTEIRLGGIAWSEVAPLAYLNGKLLGVGESVAGRRVARIDRDRVRLEGAGSALVLTLR